MELVNKVYLGDCLELMPTIVPDKSVDMIFCDLPYGTTNCKWDSTIPLNYHIGGLDRGTFLHEQYIHGIPYKEAIDGWEFRKEKGLWQHYNRVLKDDGVILLFAQTPFDKVLGESNLNMLRYEWVWEKTQATGHLNAKKMPMKAHENILVFYKDKPSNVETKDFHRTYNPQKTTGHERKVSKGYQRDICIRRREEKYGDDYLYGKETTAVDYDSTERYPRSVLTFASDKQKSKLHPTQKPLALVEYMIKTYTNEGDLILDNTCGSGTTPLGAEKLGRKWIAMEKEEKYVNITNKRIEEWRK